MYVYSSFEIDEDKFILFCQIGTVGSVVNKNPSVAEIDKNEALLIKFYIISD